MNPSEDSSRDSSPVSNDEEREMNSTEDASQSVTSSEKMEDLSEEILNVGPKEDANTDTTHSTSEDSHTSRPGHHLKGSDHEIIKELEEAVKRELDARKELEEMLIKMEHHLKTEEDARKHAERSLDVAIENESRLKKEYTASVHNQAEREQLIERQRLDTEKEREALEDLRREIETEVNAAREEAQKAAEDLKSAEDRVRASERAEMAKMEAEYQKRISFLGFELERVRQELVIRTKLLSEEMERWRQQAEFATATVIEAKSEVTERKRDLDSTREKMDRLMDRLHTGREQGLMLQASLTAANAYTAQAQRSLVQSLESTFQANIQQALPWGGQNGTQMPVMNANISETMAPVHRVTEPSQTKEGNTDRRRLLEGNKPTTKPKPTRNARRARQ